MKKFSEQILDALKEGVELHGSAYKLAKASGVQLPTLGRWLEGTPPRLAAVEPVMDALHAQIVLPGKDYASYEFLPCGMPYLDEAGLLQMRERPHAPIALERHWLRNADIHPASSVMVEVADEAMEPLFGKGDFVLVDRADVYPQAGRVYLLTTQKNDLRILRLKSEAGLAWSLLAENPACHWYNEQVPDISHIQIHGRVRWSSRMF